MKTKTSYTTTTITMDRKVLAKLKHMSVMSSVDGGPHISVSKLVTDAVVQMLKPRRGRNER